MGIFNKLNKTEPNNRCRLLLRKRCPYSKFFWSVLSRIWTENEPEKLRIPTLFMQSSASSNFVGIWVALLQTIHISALQEVLKLLFLRSSFITSPISSQCPPKTSYLWYFYRLYMNLSADFCCKLNDGVLTSCKSKILS